MIHPETRDGNPLSLDPPPLTHDSVAVTVAVGVSVGIGVSVGDGVPVGSGVGVGVSVGTGVAGISSVGWVVGVTVGVLFGSG